MSDTGYIRLSVPELRKVSLLHLISGMDEDGHGQDHAGAVPTAITGYTEWVSRDCPPITVGWDWEMLAQHTSVRLRRVSSASSNVMLQNVEQVDLGPAKTALLLEDFIDGIEWQSETLEHIGIRYTC